MEVNAFREFVRCCREVESVSEDQLMEGLKNLGYRLRPEEMSILAQQVDPKRQSGAISKYAFLASQIDWHRDDLRSPPYHLSTRHALGYSLAPWTSSPPRSSTLSPFIASSI